VCVALAVIVVVAIVVVAPFAAVAFIYSITHGLLSCLSASGAASDWAPNFYS